MVGPGCLAAVRDATEALRDLPGIANVSSVTGAPRVRTVHGAVAVTPWLASDGPIDSAAAARLRERPDVAGRLLASDRRAAIIEADLAVWALGRPMAGRMGEVIDQLQPAVVPGGIGSVDRSCDADKNVRVLSGVAGIGEAVPLPDAVIRGIGRETRCSRALLDYRCARQLRPENEARPGWGAAG